MKQTLLILVSTLVLSSCRTFLTIPNYVSSKELASLTIGSTKNQVKTNLGNTSPFDILAGWSQGCEVHHYKYKQTQKELFPSEEDLESGLTNGRKLYPNDDANAYLVYKNGKLSSLLTDIGKSELEELLKDVTKITEVCSEKNLRGCMDPESLNYNEDAIIADGNCEYCPCDFVKNPDYNKNRPVSSCNTKCIAVKKPGDNSVNGAEKKKSCSNCDIIDRLSNGKAGVNVNLNLSEDN
jgi:Zn-finger protein